ncbi:transporter substrate-binding domain-containing protein, partial [Cobetia sp.]
MAAALGATTLGSLAAQADTLKVGMSGGYFPFTFVKQDKLQGFEVDVLNAVGEITGDDIEFVTMSFSGLIGS